MIPYTHEHHDGAIQTWREPPTCGLTKPHTGESRERRAATDVSDATMLIHVAVAVDVRSGSAASGVGTTSQVPLRVPVCGTKNQEPARALVLPVLLWHAAGWPKCIARRTRYAITFYFGYPLPGGSCCSSSA